MLRTKAGLQYLTYVQSILGFAAIIAQLARLMKGGEEKCVWT